VTSAFRVQSDSGAPHGESVPAIARSLGTRRPWASGVPPGGCSSRPVPEGIRRRAISCRRRWWCTGAGCRCRGPGCLRRRSRLSRPRFRGPTGATASRGRGLRGAGATVPGSCARPGKARMYASNWASSPRCCRFRARTSTQLKHAADTAPRPSRQRRTVRPALLLGYRPMATAVRASVRPARWQACCSPLASRASSSAGSVTSR
jgi:hypothetical protein